MASAPPTAKPAQTGGQAQAANGNQRKAVDFVSEDDVRAVKNAGYDDAQVIEIVLHVALNTWTNYINEVAKTEVDFPVITPRKAA